MPAKRLLITLAVTLLASCATSPPRGAPTGDPLDHRLDQWVSPTLTRFQSESEFRHYLRDASRIARARGFHWAHSPDSFGNSDDEDIVVTGSRIPAPPPAPPPPPMEAASGESITNVQTHGVDEGDIVKRIGNYLIVLQDGRLFTIDIRPGNAPGLRFADRANVYRNAGQQMWYDEMLVYGRRVLVTGYSYELQATELTVFSLGDDGKLTRDGAFALSSNDYYDIENYATRLVDDKLVIYSPLDLTRINPDNPFKWPLIRRWIRDDEHGDPIYSAGEVLYNARAIYRPLTSSLQPFVHTITVCPLGAPSGHADLTCHADAFVGPPEREFYIAPDAAYLWTYGDTAHDYDSHDACDPAQSNAFQAAETATLFRAPFDGSPGALQVRGVPRDQLAFDATADTFRALLAWTRDNCGPNGDQARVNLKLFSIPTRDFSTTSRTASADHFADVPSLDASIFEERFTDRYVIYGGRQNYSQRPPEEGDDPILHAQVVAAPLDNPAQATRLEAPHNMIRIERLGANAVLTGYRDDAGLRVSVLDLSATPRIAQTTLLPHRYEAEGRTHAFNARVGADGAGLMGLPTVEMRKQSGREWWRSDSSDISYFNVAGSALTLAGELTSAKNNVDPTYKCEVSCIDWYGNSRPIFTDGRVFALTGTELVEGVIAHNHIRERRRVNLSAPPP